MKRRKDFIKTTKQRHEAAKEKVPKPKAPAVKASETTVGKQQGMFMQTVAHWKQKKGAPPTKGGFVYYNLYWKSLQVFKAHCRIFFLLLKNLIFTYDVLKILYVC